MLRKINFIQVIFFKTNIYAADLSNSDLVLRMFRQLYSKTRQQFLRERERRERKLIKRFVCSAAKAV